MPHIGQMFFPDQLGRYLLHAALFFISLTVIFPLCVWEWVSSWYFRTCMCGSVVWNLLLNIFSLNFCVHIYIYICLCIYICVCVCMFPAWFFRSRTSLPQDLVNGVFNETWTYACFSNTHPQTHNDKTYQISMRGKAGSGKHALRKRVDGLYINHWKLFKLQTRASSSLIAYLITRPFAKHVFWRKQKAVNTHVCKNKISKF